MPFVCDSISFKISGMVIRALIGGRFGVAPEITDRLKVNAAYGRNMFKRQTDDVPDVIHIDTRDQCWNQHHTETMFLTAFDDFYLFGN